MSRVQKNALNRKTQRRKIILMLALIVCIVIIFDAILVYKLRLTPSVIHSKADQNKIVTKIELDKENLTLKYEGNILNLDAPIYVENNRYYIPLLEILKKSGIVNNPPIKGKISFTYDDSKIVIDPERDIYITDNETHNFKKKSLLTENEVYISLFDFYKILNLKTLWEDNTKSISFYRNRDTLPQRILPPKGKPALIRLEDISVDQKYATLASLEKLRVVADYLYRENIPFHVAWVPRFIDPTKKIDNDPSEQYSFYNSDFVYTLDYLIDKKGIIGLHGYTHQYGKTVSIEAKEFHSSPKDSIPDTDEYNKQKIDKAIAAANKLEVPYAFFESPHYATNPKLLKILEKDFDVIYQPYNSSKFFSKVVVIKNQSRISRYIPTPLDFVNDKRDVNNMIKRIDALKPEILGSFFYHPYLEFNDIKVTRDNEGYPTYTYLDSSPLHLIIDKMRGKGYTFVSVEDIKQ